VFFKNYTYFTLPFREAGPGGIGPLPGGLTNYCPSVLDTVSWVILPVKIVPNMTYNVFGGTWNPTLLYYYRLEEEEDQLLYIDILFTYVLTNEFAFVPIGRREWRRCTDPEQTLRPAAESRPESIEQTERRVV